MKNLKLDSYITEARELKIYLCGPTVYDDVHIGNVAPVLIFDFLIRYFKYKGQKLLYIHNITDIDDKIINKAQLENKSESEISEHYYREYMGVLEGLNILKPDKMPKVSEHIEDIQEVISKLMDSGYAQINEDKDVVFLINKAKNYGEVSGQKLENLENISDFCLWKSTKVGITGKSPWGSGRPGWHSECFAFIGKYFGGTADIHGGGVDLKFPHHENENAHCRALCGLPIANKGIHIGHVTSGKDGEKISKSSGKRDYIVKELLKKYSGNVLRFLFLNNRYSSPMQISEEILEAADSEGKKIERLLNKTKTHLLINKLYDENNEKHIKEEFLKYIADDLNLPEALTGIQQKRKKLGSSIKKEDGRESSEHYHDIKDHLEFLGFELKNEHSDENIKLILCGNRLVNEKRYKEADEIRELLIKKKLI